MAENSSIEWTDHTFNPWVGCQRVSKGCENCYAEEMMDKRYGRVKWGPQGTREVTSDNNWKQPLKWNRAAEKAGERRRVFCASLADVFENRLELLEPQLRLFRLIHATPYLDWLLLTKRPENIIQVINDVVFAEQRTGENYPFQNSLMRWLSGKPPANVWLGTSVENQQTADERIPHLLKVPAAVRFLSCEPLLGAVDLTWIEFEPGGIVNSLRYTPVNTESEWLGFQGHIDWVIAGGESGNGARPMHPDWARSLRDQCVAAGVPYLFKQWGEWVPFLGDCGGPVSTSAALPGSKTGATLPDGKQEVTWADGSRKVVDELYLDNNTPILRVGKKAAGRLLDGREWNQFPESNKVVAPTL